MELQHRSHAGDAVGIIRPEICLDCRDWVAGWLVGWTAGDQRSYVLRLRADIDEVVQRSKRRTMADDIVDVLTIGRIR